MVEGGGHRDGGSHAGVGWVADGDPFGADGGLGIGRKEGDGASGGELRRQPVVGGDAGVVRYVG
jgi:hypothetical protein